MYCFVLSVQMVKRLDKMDNLDTHSIRVSDLSTTQIFPLE